MPETRGASNPLARRLSYRQRQRILDLAVTGRTLVDGRRPLPNALVLGAQRAGTSSLFKWLETHPDVVTSLRKETDYFTSEYFRGEAWYRGHFPSRARHGVHRSARLFTFEASPSYLVHPLAPGRAAALVPDAKLIALLRDPVERTASQYIHETSGGRESLTLEEALAAEPQRLAEEMKKLAADALYPAKPFLRYSYVTRGRYAEQLERWFQHFDSDRVLVVRSEDLYGAPAQTFARILDFLGLRPHTPPGFGNVSRPSGSRSDPMSPEVRRHLVAYFRPHNDALRDLVGHDFGWDSDVKTTPGRP